MLPFVTFGSWTSELCVQYCPVQPVSTTASEHLCLPKRGSRTQTAIDNGLELTALTKVTRGFELMQDSCLLAYVALPTTGSAGTFALIAISSGATVSRN